MTTSIPPGDDFTGLVDNVIDSGAVVAAAMFLGLSEDSREKVTTLRSRGWHLCFEIRLDPEGGASAVLTMTSLDGCKRLAVSELTAEPLQ